MNEKFKEWLFQKVFPSKKHKLKKQANTILFLNRLSLEQQRIIERLKPYSESVKLKGIQFKTVEKAIEKLKPTKGYEVLDQTYKVCSWKDIYKFCKWWKQNRWSPRVENSHDCLPWDTLLLNKKGKTLNICDVQEGEEIIGKNGMPTKVLSKQDKGVLQTLKIETRRGILECTGNHKVWIVEDGKEKEILAKELKIGDSLLSCDKLGIDDNIINEPVDFFELLGYYIADGWKQHTAIQISGRDGHPKEKQKRRCKEITDLLGWNSTIHFKSIYINPKEKNELFFECGNNAHNKKVFNIPTESNKIKSLLKGLQADCSKASNSCSITYNTVSDELILNIRLLHKLLGESMSVKFQENCGGFVNGSIWRGTPYLCRERNNKIKSIKTGRLVQCYDITTENKGIYLIQSDTVVHNCDDYRREWLYDFKKWIPESPMGQVTLTRPDYRHDAIVGLCTDSKGKLVTIFVDPERNKRWKYKYERATSYEIIQI